jgi:hypothetical protein
METAESLAASLDLNSIGWRTVTVIPITPEEKKSISACTPLPQSEWGARHNSRRGQLKSHTQHKFDGSESNTSSTEAKD